MLAIFSLQARLAAGDSSCGDCLGASLAASVTNHLRCRWSVCTWVRLDTCSLRAAAAAAAAAAEVCVARRAQRGVSVKARSIGCGRQKGNELRALELGCRLEGLVHHVAQKSL